MKIDRHNYEMYFLLYVDNELPAGERKAVEVFVADNADLQPELKSLMNTSLPPEEMRFISKNELYKTSDRAEILQQQMLLNLDNELSPSLKENLEHEINADETLKEAWEVLQITKLDSREKISFKGRAILYRYERSNIISMRFWRTVVAAAVIAVGLFAGFLIFTKEKEPVSVASTSNNKASKKAATDVANEVNSTQKNPVEKASPGEIAVSFEKDQSPFRKEKNVSVADEISENVRAIAGPAKKAKESFQEETNGLPKTVLENINNRKSNQITLRPVQDVNAFTTGKENPQESKSILATVTPAKRLLDTELTALPAASGVNSFARNAMLDATAAETNDNHILFVSEEKINRSKVSGLFRKVKRVLTRNANIATGNSVKIAGFEIAAR